MAILIDNDQVEFLGIEVIFIGEDDPRGSVWINFNKSLSLIYGKNGAGKSTLINAITAFIEGQSLEDDGILLHGYARLRNPSKSCSIIDQCIKSMPTTPILSEWEGVDTSYVSERYRKVKEALGLPHGKWESSLFSATPESWDDLEMDWNKFVSHYLFLGLDEYEFQEETVNNFFDELMEIKSFAQHLISERIFCLQPCGRENSAEWRVSLAARLDNADVGVAYEKLIQESGSAISNEATGLEVSLFLQNIWILAERSEMPRTSSPYVRAARIGSQKVGSLGICVVDLNEDLDLEEWTKRRIAEIAHTSGVSILDPWFSDSPVDITPTSIFALKSDNKERSQIDDLDEDDETVWAATFGSQLTLIGRTIDFDFIGERKVLLQRALTFIAKELPEELGIGDLRIRFERDLGLWIFGRPGVLEAYDERSETWIPVSSTSNATQKIIGMAIKIHSDIRASSEVVIAAGDEIDRGLHNSAINGLYKMLSSSIETSFVATHSSVALSAKLGERLHVHRGADGAVLVSPVSNSDFLSTSASNFGVRVNELIGMIDLVVAVEGLHDKLVLEHFIRLDERLSGSNILIISMTGVNNATNLVDANFLLSYTDLRILVVVDNTSKSDLQLTWQATREQQQSGQSSLKLAKALRIRAEDLRKQSWHEQRCMVELLAAATEGDLLHRLRMSGHIYMDIEMALDPKYFLLDKDWMELETEFDAYKASASSSVRNFKDFLRLIYNVSIDANSIKVALSMTQEIPRGIKSVIDDIVANAFQTDLMNELF